MPGPTLTAAELAAELGRAPDWLHVNWRRLVREQAMPDPLHAPPAPLVWSRAQVWAWLDRALPPQQRIAAAAYRAAMAAAAGEMLAPAAAVEEAVWRDTLDRHMTPGAARR